MTQYDAPTITELGSLEDLTQGTPGAEGNDFLFVAALDKAVDLGVGVDNLSF